MIPFHNARSGGSVIALLAATTLLCIASSHVSAQASPADDTRASVAVLDFNVAALRDAASWAPLGKAIPRILMTELGANPDLRIIERERLQAVLDELKLTASAVVDPATAARVGRLVGARYMVSGSAAIDPRNVLRIDVHGFKVETSVHEYRESLTGKADDVLDLVAQIGQKAAKNFDPTPFDAPSGRSSGRAARPTKEGLRVAMLLGNAIDLQDRRDVDGAKAIVRQALAIAPENPSARALLASLEGQR